MRDSVLQATVRGADRDTPRPCNRPGRVFIDAIRHDRDIATRHQHPAPVPDDDAPSPVISGHPDATRTDQDTGQETIGGTGTVTPARLPVFANLHKVVWRTIVNAWDHGIVG